LLADGGGVDDMALDRLVMREAVVLDVSRKSANEGVTAQDLDRTGVNPAPGQVAVIKTLWTDRAWGKPEFWRDTVYLDPSVGEWVAAREVAAVAMDCFPEKPFWRMTLGPNERAAQSQDLAQGRHSHDPAPHPSRSHRESLHADRIAAAYWHGRLARARHRHRRLTKRVRNPATCAAPKWGV
jgi:kynurenine formamidase